MGIIQSVLQSLVPEEQNERPTFQHGNPISSRNYYSNTAERPQHTRRNQTLESSYPRENENNSTTVPHQMKCLTISVPKARFSSSLDHTVVDDKVQKRSSSSANSLIKDQDPARCVYRPERTTGSIGSSSGVKKRDKKEGAVMINYRVVTPPPEMAGRWIKHYSSRRRILLVGEGDFSFSACLAEAFVSAPNMIATSLNSKDFLKKNYQNAPSNIAKLRSSGCRVMHGIDATKMANHPILGQLIFDRIIYNFPFAGFFRKKLSRDSVLHRHRRLVSLFLMNAKEMIDENGEIHITHKTNGIHMEWKIESIASSHGLRLIEAVKFNLRYYPGYNTKCGFGGDNDFNCYPSKTYKFGPKKIRC